ncbi:sigma-54 dependent transcriptional regulator [Congregibacter brevis]|uniref:Sigma-54 dependent transcriptional regulator n=1 Tax=Congregibacter brevis TaxID=3081201 RepID=A0ABZ0ID35_9GAMM|nr:sigma-54 dependent transcriptional regulator [Congregibacter sp. IMCC45268]
MSNSQTARVLIVDDEPDIRELLEITLGRMGLDTVSAANLREAYQLLDDENPLQLCLTDMRLPDGNGIELVEHIQATQPSLPVAMITAHGNVDSAIRALKAGAFDFISKPVALEKLRSLISAALELDPIDAAGDVSDDNELIGETHQMDKLRTQIAKLARSQAPVHIRGESGSGKEVVARNIHGKGPRAAGPFVAVNCGAIPAELIESELFGHLKGSFTGASRDKLGLFQAAEGGTLFLDEVADLPLAMQVKLLRAIQEKRVRPVGANEEVATDVRLLSATHKSLAKEVAEGRFREDLFFRVNVIELEVPSLRERKDDLPVLSRALIKRIADAHHSEIPAISPAAIATMNNYQFPGNVRELENMLERAFALCEADVIDAEDLQIGSIETPITSAALEKSDAKGSQLNEVAGDLDGYLADIERGILSEALDAHRWNRTETAKALGVSFRSLRYRMKKLELDD